MATATKRPEVKKMVNALLLKPEDIILPENSRQFDHSEEDIMETVRSYDDHGQDTPITVRKGPDGKYVCTIGQRRTKAALKFNELHPTKKMLLMAVCCDDSDEDAFVKAIDENRADLRSNTSVVDDAFNAKTLREKFGWQDKDIAAKYNWHLSHLSRMKKLTSLRKSVLRLVHDKEISFDTACNLSELDEVDQDDVIARAVARVKEDASKQDEAFGNWIGDIKDGMPPLVPAESANGAAKPEGGDGADGEKAPAKPKKPGKKAVNREVQKEIAAKKKAQGGEAAKLPAPTLSRVKEVVNDNFTTTSCPEAMYQFGCLFLNFVTGRGGVDEKKFVAKAKEIFSGKLEPSAEKTPAKKPGKK